jgi:hypothetical protein
MENLRVRKLIDDLTSQAALQMATALRPLIRARLEEVCREALGIVTREIEESILVGETPPAVSPEGFPLAALPLALAGISIPPPKPVSPPAPTAPAAPPAEPLTLDDHLGIARAGKQWKCASCGKKFPTRRGASTHRRRCAGRVDA